MVKCLIMVKGTPIEEYYPFRWHESRTEVQEEAEEVVVKEVVKELTEEQIRLQKLDELYN